MGRILFYSVHSLVPSTKITRIVQVPFRINTCTADDSASLVDRLIARV